MPGEDKSLPFEDARAEYEAYLIAQVFEATRGCRRIAYDILGCWETASDLYQDVMIVFLMKVRGGEKIRYPRAWFNTCIRNSALTLLKGRKRMAEERYLVDCWATNAPSPEDLVYHREVREAVAALEEEAKLIFLSQALADLNAAETARKLNMTYGAVRSKYYRTRHALKASLGLKPPLPTAPKLKASGDAES